MDDNADWLSEDVVEAAPEPPVAAAADAGAEAPPAAAAAAEGDALPAAEPERPRDPNKLILFRHWQRPLRPQYQYLYEYRKNYYDDVLDYMDRRSKGLQREIPRAQTWAERALRTYTRSSSSVATSYERRKADAYLVSSIHSGAKFYNYHSKEYMCRRFPAMLR